MVRRTARDAEVNGRIPHHGIFLHRVLGRHVLFSRLPLDLHIVAVFCLTHGCGIRGYDCQLHTRSNLLEEF
jgi:hypothetical protein